MPRMRLFAMLRTANRANWAGSPKRELLAAAAWLPAFAIALLFVFQISLAGALRSRAPQLALAWVPADSEARARLAGVLTAPGSSSQAHEVAQKLAREAVRRSPVNAMALRSLALAAGSGDNAAQAGKLMAEAERLSRRDFPTQTWLIERALRDGDVVGAMRHFDIGMRSSVSSRQLLFPLMANASADPAMAAAIKDRLRDKPEWRFAYLHYLVNFDPDPKRGLDLAREFLDPRVPDERADLISFIDRLSAAGQYAAAWDIYARFNLGPKASSVSDGGFERDDGVPPFAWELMQDNDLGAYAEAAPDGKGQVLRLVAHSGRIGQVARQLMRLGPGSYRLRALLGDIPEDAFDRPQVTVSCAARTDQRAVLTLRPANSGQQARRLEGRFSVPPRCPFQWLAISIAGDGPLRDVVPWIDEVQVVEDN